MSTLPTTDGPVASAAGPFRVRVEHLVLLPAVPSGMDFGEIGGKLKQYRTTTEDDHPCTVRRRAGLPEPYWELLDGRHRFFAAVISGRPDVLAVVEE